MVWIGMTLVWAGYSVGLYGYSLVRGYNLTLAQMVSPTKWYSGQWPPAKAGNEQILPTGNAAGLQTTAFVAVNAPAGNAANSSGGGVTPGQPAGGLANVAISPAAAPAHGWGSGGQWNALTHIVNAESGGNPTAQGPPVAGLGQAFGIAQALGHGTSCSQGTITNQYGPSYGLSCAQARAANSGNAVQQARWMMGYIKATYGTPANAWAFHLANNAY
jgi:hypothetical protein